MGKIKAAVCREFGQELVIEELDLAPPGPGEVEVTLGACAICHSDIAFLDGGWGGTLPAVFGHEAAGKITALGEGVTGFSDGQNVLVTLIRACQSCATCGSGMPVQCAETIPSDALTSQGQPVNAAMHCGAFAEKVVVHHSQLAALPAEMPTDVAALMACGVITGIGAVVNTAQVRPGQVVVVIGAGGVGLNAIQGARIAGASRIVAVDMLPEKLEIAKSFGATDGILATDNAPWDKLAKITGGRLADAVFVTVGAIPAFETAPRYLAPLGKMYLVGLPHSGQTASYEPVIIAALGQGFQGTKMGDVVLARDIPWLLDLYAQGRLILDDLISERFPLEQINDAIAATRTGSAKRNVIVF